MWYHDHLYSIEIAVPLDSADQLYEYLLGALNNFSPYTGRFEMRKMKCLVLKRDIGFKESADTAARPVNWLFGKDTMYMLNGKVDLLIKRLDAVKFLNFPVVDGTGYDGKFDLHFSTVPTEITGLQQELRLNGLHFIEEEREVKLFVLRNK